MELSRRRLLATAVASAAGSLILPGRSAQAATRQTSSQTSPLPAVDDRDSVFTRHGAGPLYWTTYGYNQPHNDYIPQSEWLKNLDWLQATLKPSGYTMACTDGWVDFITSTNANGYVTKYNDNWTMTWADMASDLTSRGMELGVYYNPLWVTRAAVEDPTKTVVGRPDVKIADLVNDGDWFNGNHTIYWIDVTKDGAKEFIQGYVDYFRKLGAAYLRIDFLCWYETGFDQNMGNVGVAHGTDNYRTALGWMSEAAGDGIELSLVMPNLSNHGANERAYGDLARIDNDAGSGGWERLGGGRQNWQPYWSQWDTPFLGFTGFADISGRGQLILDGDFLLMSKFGSDDERRTAISLFTMAGSPLAAADTYDMIGSTAPFFTNSELLDLNQCGFAGKPYFSNATAFSTDSSSRDPERWFGQLPDGSWVVGLFNRQYSSATRAVDFAADLGLTAAAPVRDLWAHQDLGTATSHSVSLAAHACRVIKITPSGTPRYQANVAGWGGGAGFGNTAAGYSGFGYVSGLGAVGARVVFGVAAATAGNTKITLRYAAQGAATLTLAATSESGTAGGSPVQVSLPSTGSWNTWATASVQVPLVQGTNVLTIEHASGDSGEVYLDWIEAGSGGGSTGIPPGAPGTPTASGTTGTGTTLTWTASAAGTAAVKDYEVYQAGADGSSLLLGATPDAATRTFTVSGLTAGTTYSFFVIARDTTGATSAPSGTVQVATTGGGGNSGGGGGTATVSYAVEGDWGTGFTAQLILTNTGAQDLGAWNLAFAFAGDQKVNSGWGGTWAQSGKNVTVTGSGLAAGQSVYLGFTGSYSGTNVAPTAFTVNGKAAGNG
jgi:alpha-glucosidase